jgi:PhnB protein
MIKSLIPYLIFPGTCREAMEFYKDALGGKITSMQTFEESPISVSMDSKNRIFNAELKIDDIIIKASDDLADHNVTMGNNFSIYLVFSDQESKEKAFTNLAEDGKILFPTEDNFGMLSDKYGVRWMMIHNE